MKGGKKQKNNIQRHPVAVNSAPGMRQAIAGVPVESNPLAQAIAPHSVTVVQVIGPAKVTCAIPSAPGAVQTFGTHPFPVRIPPSVLQETVGTPPPLLNPGPQVTAPHVVTEVQGFDAVR